MQYIVMGSLTTSLREKRPVVYRGTTTRVPQHMEVKHPDWASNTWKMWMWSLHDLGAPVS